MKALPTPGGTSEVEQEQDAAPPEEPVDQPQDDGRQWAGDPYDEGDEPQPDDPSVTARFSAPGGEEAWLEQAQDGTLTGWVRDPSGQVYRYSDADAWAVDVDDAGMAPATGGQPPADDQQQNPPAEDGAAGPVPDELQQ